MIIALFIRARQKKVARLVAEEAERKRVAAEQEAAQKKAEAEAAARAAKEKEKLDGLPITTPAALALKMKLSVLGNSGEQRDYGIILSDRAFIGRSAECDLAIRDDEEISKRHCELTIQSGYVMISDLNSTNGTFVNGVPVKTGHRLKSGDLVLLGRTELRITF